ncbi:MAG: RNA polymerase sigma factor [Bacteroidales bacterium]|nr:RNA polymerase sigma factor [Bacteroidales bacterium]
MTRQEATQFYRTHSKALYNTALRIVRDPAEAEEIMQDTLMRYIQRGVRSATPAQAAAWLRTTCVRMGIDALRRRKKALTVVDDIPFDEVEEDVDMSGEMDILRIREAMERLPHPYGLILDLVLIEGMDYAGISRMTGQKETTLRSWYSRGRAKLVKELKTSMI